MKARTLLLSIVAAISFVPGGDALAEPMPSAESRTAIVSPSRFGGEATGGGPRVGDRVPGWLERRLARAFALAARRLRESPSCRLLFADQGRDGSTTLAAARFHPATLEDEQSRCRRTAALTTVGGRRTRLCRSFARLATRDAAVTLLHESLHHAGLREYPSDPEAMTSPEINWLVKESCAL